MVMLNIVKSNLCGGGRTYQKRHCKSARSCKSFKGCKSLAVRALEAVRASWAVRAPKAVRASEAVRASWAVRAPEASKNLAPVEVAYPKINLHAVFVSPWFRFAGLKRQRHQYNRHFSARPC